MPNFISKRLHEPEGLIDPTGLLALAGDPKLQHPLVPSLQTLLSQNLSLMESGSAPVVILLGIFDTEASARACINLTGKNEEEIPDGLVTSTKWHVLMGNCDERNFFSLPLEEYYAGHLQLYLF